VIFLSGHGDLASGVRAMKAGAVDFLSKSVERDALLAAIRRALALDAAPHACRSTAAKCVPRTGLHQRRPVLPDLPMR
jgi:FixJ family two-component response regulator